MVLKEWSMGPWGALGLFQRTIWVKIILIIILRNYLLFFFYHIDIYTDGTKAVVVKLLAQIKAVVPSVLVAIVIFTNMH